MTDRLMDAMAGARPVLCPYLHLPAQSGSTRVLRSMRRGYDREGYLEKIAALRRRMPEMVFGTDLIVGFPGESEAEFEETLTLLDEVGYDTVYSFAYSERPGTVALAIEGALPEAERARRLQALQTRQQGIQRERMQRWVGRRVPVLVEGRSKRDPDKWSGRTPENRVVNFRGEAQVGRTVEVAVRSATAFSLSGESAARVDPLLRARV